MVAKNINMTQNAPSYHNLDNNTPLHFLTESFKQPFPNIKFKSVTTLEIEKITKHLKLKNYSGCDGISTKLIKIFSSYLNSPLTYICNKSLSSGIFPHRIK